MQKEPLIKDVGWQPYYKHKFMKIKTYTVEEINSILEGELQGTCKTLIDGAEEIKKAQKNHITFIGNQKFTKFWKDSKACVAIVDGKLTVEPIEGKAIIKVKNADLAMAKILEIFTPPSPSLEPEIHPTAVIDKTAKIGKGCKIGAGTYVGKNVVLGEEVILYPNVTVFDDTTIGNKTVVWSGTVIRERTEIGQSCIFHNNVSIGADGFGYRPSSDGNGLVKIPHIGNVIIGNQVEIGANSCVDRGKFSATIVGDGCKIDNLVQIAHNCVLGQSCIMAGSSGLAGSVTLGNGVIIGGSASIKDHVTIGDGATVGAGSGVIANVSAGKTVLGYPATDAREMLKQWVALRKLARD